MSQPPPGVSPDVIASIGDSWIQAYLRLRQAVVDGELTTLSEVKEFARELQCGMTERHPPPMIAAFIAADIAITCPLLTDALWKP
jgi:hypothetical protein